MNIVLEMDRIEAQALLSHIQDTQGKKSGKVIRAVAKRLRAALEDYKRLAISPR